MTFTPTSYTTLLRRALECFSESKGHLHFTARTMSGIGQSGADVRPAQLRNGIPEGVLRLLADGWSVRLHPFSRTSGHALIDLPALVVCWQLQSELQHRRLVVREDEKARVRAALRRMPPPSLLVDGAHEVVGVWRLERPVSLITAARTACVRIASRLGADVRGPDDPASWSIPLCGVVRNWNTSPLENIAIVMSAPHAIYTLADLEPRSQPKEQKTDGTAGHPSRRERGARTVEVAR